MLGQRVRSKSYGFFIKNHIFRSKVKSVNFSRHKRGGEKILYIKGYPQKPHLDERLQSCSNSKVSKLYIVQLREMRIHMTLQVIRNQNILLQSVILNS